MTDRLVTDADDALVARADNGPHRGWSTFDLKLEGARFQLLHELITTEFDQAEAEHLVSELESLAQSYGYATTDSYLCAASDMSDDEIDDNPELSFEKQNIFEEDGLELDYFIEVRKSEAILFAHASDEARLFLAPKSEDGRYGIVHEKMSDAFRKGRDMRKDQEFSSPRP